MQIHKVKRTTSNKRGKIIGRGGKRGTTCGKGTKGQLARSGRKLRPEFRDLIKKIPKLRGYRFNSIQTKPAVVSIADILINFKDGDTISKKALLSANLIQKGKGRVPLVKILGKEKVDKKLKFVDCLVSASVKDSVLKAGGEVNEKVNKPKKS